MDQFNTSIWTTSSPFLQSDSSDIAKNNASQTAQYVGFFLLSAVVLGLPGNALVVVVYVTNMTTSTRVYLFALAVADTAICISGIVLSLMFDVTRSLVAAVISLIILVVAVTFSMVLLVFVSIERLVAVRLPQTFNMNPTRAKKYILVLLFIAVLFATVQGCADYMNYTVFHAFVRTGFLTGSAFIMVTCYTLIGATLLKKVKISSKRIADMNIHLSRESNNLAFVTVQSDVTQSPPVTGVIRIIAKQTQNVKSIALLFIITVVLLCVACHWCYVLWVLKYLTTSYIYISSIQSSTRSSTAWRAQCSGKMCDSFIARHGPNCMLVTLKYKCPL